MPDYVPLWVTLEQGTVVEGTIQQLFEGHDMNYIECINVDYKSTRKESFYGKHLCVKLMISYVKCSFSNSCVLCQIFSLMSKAVVMCMLLLTNMWKWNDLKVTTNIMLNNMGYRLDSFLLIFMICVFDFIPFGC